MGVIWSASPAIVRILGKKGSIDEGTHHQRLSMHSCEVPLWFF